jgi:pimeloyl-ACP methyl ester carboxylesterase
MIDGTTTSDDPTIETRTVAVGDIEVAYETFGDPTDPTILLVMGLGTQMIAWPDRLCRDLAAAGHHVVRYDNRDMGLTTHLDDAPAPTIPQMLRGRDLAYTISDMAGDGVGLLDALGIERAHVVGASMGGFISQTIAVEHPDRVATLTLIMTSTGARRVGYPSRRVIQSFLSRPTVTSRDEAIAAAVATYELLGSPHLDVAHVREMAGRSYDRAYDPAGTQRQLAAILNQPNRTAALRRLRTPTIVLHGLDDPIVNVSGGIALARAIPDARFVGYHGTGHDVPVTRMAEVRDEVLAHIARCAAAVPVPA